MTQHLSHRGQAQDTHVANAVIGLAEARFTGNHSSGSNDLGRVLTAVLVGDAVNARNSSMLEQRIRRRLDNANQGGQKVENPDLRQVVALGVLAEASLEQTENLASKFVIGTLEENLNGIQEVNERQSAEERAEDLTTSLADGFHTLHSLADAQHLRQNP